MPCTLPLLGLPMPRSRLRPQAFNPPASDLEAEGERKMRKRERNLGLVVSGLLAGGLFLVLLTLRSTTVYAHVVANPRDFTTGGGFRFTQSVAHATSGRVRRCR